MSKWIRKITACFLAGFMMMKTGAVTSHGAPGWPTDIGVLADAGIVMDVDSKTVLFGQRIHQTLPPASITKLLTALVVAEHASMEEMVLFSNDAVYNVESGSGNKLALDEGDQLSVEDCLYVMMLLSSNQAANALAEHVAGSREAFVDMMNEKVAELGCQDGTHFANPSGLNDDSQVVSAYDMALISVAAFQNEKVLEISSSTYHKIPATKNNPDGAGFYMEHKILMAKPGDTTYYCEGATAGKIGYTSLAGNTSVTYAVRDGRRVVSVVLKGSQPQYYIDAKNLLNFGLSSFDNVKIADHETLLQGVEQLDIGGVSWNVSELSIEEEAAITVPKGGQFTDISSTLITELPQSAPKGAVAQLQYTYNDRKVGTAWVYEESVRIAALKEKERESQMAEMNETELEETGEDTSTESEESAPSPEESEKPEKGKGIFGIKLVIGGTVLLILLGVAGFLAWKKKKEREAAARRRERRRQRLMEIGYSEEQFEKLVRDRRNDGKRRP